MDQKQKGELFHTLHHRGHTFVIPNPWDAGSAKILAAKGFEALATTSVGVDHAIGKPSSSAGRDEILANAGMIAKATPLPLSIDLEDCYGTDAKGVAETIRLAAETGAVGGSIEDVKFGSNGEPYEFREAVDRVKAAVEAATALPFKFTLTARCEHFLFGRRDMDDVLERLNAFADAGADVLYAPGLMSYEEVETVVQNVGKPVNVLLGLGGTTLGMSDMLKAGVARVSLGSALHRAAMTATLAAIDEIQVNGTFGFTRSLRGMGEIDALLE